MDGLPLILQVAIGGALLYWLAERFEAGQLLGYWYRRALLVALVAGLIRGGSGDREQWDQEVLYDHPLEIVFFTYPAGYAATMVLLRGMNTPGNGIFRRRAPHRLR